jgi:hypothetical protein
MSVAIAQLPIEEVREYLFSVDVFYGMDTDKFYHLTVLSKDARDYDDEDEYNEAVNTLCQLVSAHDDWDYNDDIHHMDIPIDRNKTITISPLTGCVQLIDSNGQAWRLHPYKFSPYEFPTKKEQADVN